MVYVTHDQVEAMTMADTIVVLRDGVVEQIGSPIELYARPRNRFVACFLGAPQMNMLAATADGAGGGQGLRLASIRGAPSSRRASSRGGLGPGTPLKVGVRPEHLAPGDGACARGSRRARSSARRRSFTRRCNRASCWLPRCAAFIAWRAAKTSASRSISDSCMCSTAPAMRCRQMDCGGMFSLGRMRMMPVDKRDDLPRCGYGRSWLDFGRNFLRCEAVIYVFDHGVSKIASRERPMRRKSLPA